MGGNYPNNIDPRPKRRKDKDNPYEIFTTGFGTDQPHYFLAFVDSTGAEQCMEIDKALFDAFDRFELNDISFMNEMDRHYERLEQTEQSLNKRAAQPQESVCWPTGRTFGASRSIWGISPPGIFTTMGW